MLRELGRRELLAFGGGVLLTLAAVNQGMVQARLVPSGSMAPTLEVGDRVAVIPTSSRATTLKRGEMLVFQPPFTSLPGESAPGGLGAFFHLSDNDYVKRCIGLGGDRLEVRQGLGVLINGTLQKEPYVLQTPNYNWGPDVVPKGKLFMLGDNRNNSFDSHYWGCLPVENVIGRPAGIIWPVSRWRRF
jgi:signal peptidase I